MTLTSLDAVSLIQTYVPTGIQLAGLLAVLASGLVMIVLGRAVLGPRILPEIALMAGWGVVSLVLTVWGVVTPRAMHIPGIALIGAAALVAFTPRGRLHRSDWIGLGRLLAMALPLLAVFAAAYPSQPDTFTNQLPNAAYLYDFGAFPADNRPPMLAVWPGFPYNLQLAAFLPALLLPDFPPSILTHVNLLLQLASALLLARWMRPANTAISVAPSWAAIGGALLLTTFLNPGFDPKIQFSGYGDPAITVAVGFAAWQALRVLDVLADGRPAGQEDLTLTLLLLAGAAIKQVSILLMGAIVGVAILIAVFDRRIGPVRALMAFVPAFIPALLLRGVWEFYVRGHFAPDAELHLMPISQWNIAAIPTILESAVRQVAGRGQFFVVLYGCCAGAVFLAMRGIERPLTRLFVMILGVTVVYTGFLFFTYVAHFQGAIGASAHSFFRYNMHLGLLMMLAVVGLVRDMWIGRGAPELGRPWHVVQAGAIVWAILTPLFLGDWIRYDRRQPQPLVWDIAEFAAPYFHDTDRVALLLPGDDRSVAYRLRVAIAMTLPRQPQVSFHDIPRADMRALDEAGKAGDRYALVSCVPEAFARALGRDTVKGRSALLVNEDGRWRIIDTFVFPPDLPPVEAWSTQLSPGPFCRGDS